MKRNVSVTKLDSVVQRARRNSLADLLNRSSLRYPEKTALIYKDRKVTYMELNKLVNKTANSLRKKGVVKGDRLAIYSRNNLDFIIVKFALARLGAVFIPINYMLQENDIAYILNHAKVQGVFTEAAYVPRLEKVINKEVRYKIILEADENIYIDGWESLEDVQKDGSEEMVDEQIEDDALAQVLYTSGTESAPKGVMLSHKSIISEYVSCIVDGGMEASDIFLHALPFYHSAQLHVFLGPSIYLGATGIILEGAEITEMMQTIEKYKANQLFAPPTVWIALLRHESFEDFDLSSLEKCYYGAAIMPREVLRELMEALPKARFWNFYGQTEVAPLATALQPEDQLRKLGSAGIATLNVETKIVDEDGNEVSRGEVGEIVHRTPHAMLGYLNDPEQTAASFKNGWFHSGDLGKMDEEGYITIVDRKKDIIISGGVNVASREVEEVIYLMDQVAEVAVIGIPDDYWIEKITAIIIVKLGHSLSEEQVIQFCSKYLPKFKIPKAVYFQESLPKNPSGKILKKDLRDQFANKAKK